jgi:L-fuconolactonase
MTHPSTDLAPIVDAHVHFWEPGTLHYPWLDALPALRRSFLPADYAAAVGGLPVARCVLVECNCLPTETIREVRLFEQLARGDGRIAGVVAFADLTAPMTLEATLDCLTSTPRVKGIRQNIQGQPRGFARQRSFVQGVSEVGRRGWVFDVCVTHDQLGEAIALVEKCPDTRFVLDHCGKPGIRSGVREPWRQDIARLAAHENVCCKLSGLLTEADLTRWREEDLLPYATHVVECFGSDRVLYGSDWPVLTLAGDYASWFDFTARLTESWSEDERRLFYAGNAAREYGL